MIRERAEKDAEILSLKSGLNETKTQMDADKNLEIAELKEKIRILEKERFEEIEELCMAQEELAKIDSEYTELKVNILTILVPITQALHRHSVFSLFTFMSIYWGFSSLDTDVVLQ